MILLFPILLFLLTAFVFSRTGQRLLQRIFRGAGQEEPQEQERRERRLPGLPGWGSPGAARDDPQVRLFRLARRRKGRLTVSDVVVDLGFSVRDAEDLLEGMVDGRRVRAQVGPNGLSVYEFPEILARLRRS